MGNKIEEIVYEALKKETTDEILAALPSIEDCHIHIAREEEILAAQQKVMRKRLNVLKVLTTLQRMRIGLRGKS